MQVFCDVLAEEGAAFVRQHALGSKVFAACGQLGARTPAPRKLTASV